MIRELLFGFYHHPWEPWKPKPLFMVRFDPMAAQTPPHASFWAFLGTVTYHSRLGSPISCGKFLFPPHLNNKKLLLRCALNCRQTLLTPLLETETMKHPTPFHGWFWPFLNHPNPSHALFWAFPNPSHPTLGNHEAPKSLFMICFDTS